jgi:hypothetical protein
MRGLFHSLNDPNNHMCENIWYNSRTKSWPDIALTAVWNPVALKAYHHVPTKADIGKTTKCGGLYMVLQCAFCDFTQHAVHFLKIQTIIVQLVAKTCHSIIFVCFFVIL